MPIAPNRCPEILTLQPKLASRNSCLFGITSKKYFRDHLADPGHMGLTLPCLPRPPPPLEVWWAGLVALPHPDCGAAPREASLLRYLYNRILQTLPHQNLSGRGGPGERQDSVTGLVDPLMSVGY